MSWKIYESAPGAGTTAIFVDQPSGKVLVMDNLTGATKLEMNLYLVLVVLAISVMVLIGAMKRSASPKPMRV